MDILANLGSVIAALISIGWSAFVYRAAARKGELDTINKRIDGIAKDVDDHKNAGGEWREEVRGRIAAMEQAIQQFPDKDSVHKIEVAVTAMRGEVSTQGAKVNGIDDKIAILTRSTESIRDFLLNKGPGK